jgi:hypothetical protein
MLWIIGVCVAFALLLYGTEVLLVAVQEYMYRRYLNKVQPYPCVECRTGEWCEGCAYDLISEAEWQEGVREYYLEEYYPYDDDYPMGAKSMSHEL